jgi:hypothetical protein
MKIRKLKGVTFTDRAHGDHWSNRWPEMYDAITSLQMINFLNLHGDSDLRLLLHRKKIYEKIIEQPTVCEYW